MFCCVSSPKTEKTAAINEVIKSDKTSQALPLKLLLLGTGDSGKSTFVKQLKVLCGDGFSAQEIEAFGDAVLSRTMTSVHALIQATRDLSIKTSSEFDDVLDSLLATPKLNRGVANTVENLLKDKGFQEAFQRRNEFQLDCNSEYFFKNIKRFTSDDYVPTNDDIFKVRQKTSGISEYNFSTSSGIPLSLVDTGGQRSERRKWLNCFQDVAAVLYFISLDEYNLQLSEDYRVNRLQESLDLFEEITSSSFFKNKIHFFVIFNKNDLFKEKLIASPLHDLFEDFAGKPTYANSLKFIQSQFKTRFGGANEDEANNFTEKYYHPFVGCVLEADFVKVVVEEVSKMVKDFVHEEAEV